MADENTVAVPKASEESDKTPDTDKRAGDNGNEASVSKADKGESKSAGDKEHADNEKKKSNPVKSAMKAGAAIQTAQAVGQGAHMMMMFMKLKMKVMQLVSAVKSAVGALNSVVGAVLAIAGTIISVVIGGVVASITNEPVALKDEYVKTCTVYISKGAIGNNTMPINASKLQLETARRIYSVMSHYGMRPEQCFAVLGNWKHESGLDPTAVETVFDEPYSIGRTKQYITEWDFMAEQVKALSTDRRDYFNTYPSIERIGIGLGQWTNDRNKKLLTYAAFMGHSGYTGSKDDAAQWYDLTTELAFALDRSSVGDSKASWMYNFSRIGNDTFKGDKGSKNKYSDPIYPVVGPNGEHDADDYYNDTDRETARTEADSEANAKEANGDFNVPVYDADGNPVLDEHGNQTYTIDQNAYNEFWKKHYRYVLYRETTYRYTEKFLDEWEGVPGNAVDSRKNNAKAYFEQWWAASATSEPNLDAESVDTFFKVEQGYGSSVLKVLDKTRDFNTYISKVYKTDSNMTECTRYVKKYNTSIAHAAAAIAWDTRAQSVGNNGTPEYQLIHDQVIPGDSVYQSCDRTVCTAVRWSGLDDDYPKGATLNQIQYLVTSPRWTELDWGGDKNQLQPGDVLIRKDSMATGATSETGTDVHHTVIYIGNAVARMYGSTSNTACIVHGSFNSRSPAIDEWYSGLNEYHAFRCTNPMDAQESKYVGIQLAP